MAERGDALDSPAEAATVAVGADNAPDSFDAVLKRVIGGSSAPQLTPQTEIAGRFRIERALGAGGMGTVYLARDLTLSRDVAIKLHHAPGGAVRLRREAIAMARLAHPNVVTVFEVGELDQRPYVVMEYVTGTTLRDWLKERPRSVQAIVDVLVAAGEGLAAAHDAGLLHRDVKPENILIGSDGRPRVGDFGLAREVDSRDDAAPPLASAAALVPMTQTGAVLGTPAYMAPEQLTGEQVDARADQFAFCVTAWEALWGERPFRGRTLEELASALRSGARRPPPSTPRVPSRLRAALERGLATDPEARFASMRALLAAMRPPSRARQWIAAGVVGSAIVVGVGLARAGSAPDARTCLGAEARLATLWDGAARDGLAARGVPGQATARAFDARARAWADAAEASCSARVGDALSAATLDRRDACLERQRAQLAGVLARLRDAPPGVLVDGPSLVGALPPVRDCVDPTHASLALELPEEPIARALVEPYVAQLDIAGALVDVGRYDEADRLIATFPPVATRHGPLAARIALLRADLESTRGEDDRGLYEEAIRLGTASGNQVVVVQAMLDRAFTLQPREALRWYALAEVIITRLGDPANLRAHLHGNRAEAHSELGDHAAALADAERAVALRREHNGPASAPAINAIVNLSSALNAAGRDDDARRLLVDAIATAEQVLHPDDATLRSIRKNLIDLHVRAGAYADARRQYEQLVASRRRMLGERGAETFSLRLQHANILLSDGAAAEALRTLEAARASAPDAPEALLALHQMLSEAHRRTGARAEAIRAAETALDIARRGFGDEHPAVLSALGQLANVLLRASGVTRADVARAEDTARAAIAMASKVFPGDTTRASNPHNLLAQALCLRGRYAEARSHAERAIALAKDERPDVRAEAELALACALDGAGDRTAAIAAARRSLDGFARLGAAAAEDHARAQAWLAAR